MKLRPNFARAHNNRGMIFMRRGDLDLAFEEFNIAIKHQRATTRTATLNLYNRGRVQTLRKQYDRRWPTSPRRRSSIPRRRRFRYYRCITYTEMGKFDEALADCNDGRSAKYPKSIYTLTSRGNAYLAKGDLDEALNDYNEVDQDQPELYSRLCRPRPAVREAPRCRRRTLRLPRRQRRADQGRRHRNHAGTPLCQGAARGAAGRVASRRGEGDASTPPSGPRKVALIIGNGAYKNVQPLPIRPAMPG